MIDLPSPMSARSTGFTAINLLDSLNHLGGQAFMGARDAMATWPTPLATCHCFRSTRDPR
jgi:hypothetical protein